MPDLTQLGEFLKAHKKTLALAPNVAGGFDAMLTDKSVEPIETHERNGELGSGSSLEAAINDVLILQDLPY